MGKFEQDMHESQINDESRDKKISRDTQTEKLFSFLDRTGAENVLESEESRLEFIKQLDYEQFKQWLIRLNGISRDIPIKQRDLATNSYQHIGEETTPLSEDKDELLANLLEKVKTQENIEDVAQLLIVGVNFIHPFADGNGRTGRLLHELISNGYPKSEEDKVKITELVSIRRDKFVPVYEFIWYANEIQKSNLGITTELIFSENENRYISWHESGQAIALRRGAGSSLRELIFSADLISANVNFMKHLIENNSRFGLSFLTIRSFLLNKNILNDYIVNKESPKRVAIAEDELMPKLTNEDVDEIKEIYRGIIKERFEIIMDIIINPEEYRVTGNMDWENDKKEIVGMTVKDYLTKDLN